MKKHVIVVLALLFGLALGARIAHAGAQDFQLYNRTGVDIHELYVSPADSEKWEENLIQGRKLENGADITIEFDASEEAQLWDIMVKDDEGNGLYWRDVDLIRAQEIILESNGVARIKG